MKPGFLALYKKGNYFKRWIDEDDPQRERKMEERERFAMAAIAFCLKYNPEVRSTFLNVVCGIKGVRDTEDSKIDVEQKQWGDLLINTPNGIYVIEGKVGARLQPKQDFTNDSFSADGGYGAAINIAFKNDARARCYVILGYSERTLEQCRVMGIACSQKYWEDFEHRFPESEGMASDLADCLAELGVEAFYLRKIKKMKIKTSLEEASKAVEILSGTLESLGIKQDKGVSGGSYYPDHENWYFGTDLPIPRATDKMGSALVKLKELVKPKSGETIGWIGWEPVQADKCRRSVWFYCGSEEIRKALEKRLNKVLSKRDYVVNPSFAEGEKTKRYLYVASTKHSQSESEPDQPWFVSVFKVLGIASH